MDPLRRDIVNPCRRLSTPPPPPVHPRRPSLSPVRTPPPQITLQNLVKIFGAEEHAREIMGDVNLSGEGAINYDEFKTMMMDMPLDGRDQMTPRTPRTPRFTLRA